MIEKSQDLKFLYYLFQVIIYERLFTYNASIQFEEKHSRLFTNALADEKNPARVSRYETRPVTSS